MTVRLSPAAARRLGIDTPTKPRTTRRAAKGAPYHTRCVACDAEFTTEAGEDRHVAAGHHRYELVLA